MDHQQPLTKRESNCESEIRPAQQTTSLSRRSSSPFSFVHDLPSPQQLKSRFPLGWYLFGTEKELSKGPITKQRLGQSLVGFRTQSGNFGVMSSRCSHLGSDLGKGCVVGEHLQCPFHGWQYRTDGVCTKIPASEKISPFAKQVAFPTELQLGNVYFFNASKPLYPLPFFEGIDPNDLVAAPPFCYEINAPWYMVGSNGVDEQHFRWAHDRKIIGRPQVEYPNPNLHRTTATFQVVGNSINDTLTRWCGGKRVTLQVDDWSSIFILTRSTLPKTESFGVLSATPITSTRTSICVTACGWKNKTAKGRLLGRLFGRLLFDPISSRIRRYFIQAFLSSDAALIDGTDYSPHCLLEVDQQYGEYMQWVASLPNQTPQMNSPSMED